MKELFEHLGEILDMVVESFRPRWDHLNHNTERLLFVVALVAICLTCVYMGGLANSITFGV